MNAAIKPEKSNYYESTWPQSVLQCNIEKKNAVYWIIINYKSKGHETASFK